MPSSLLQMGIGWTLLAGLPLIWAVRAHSPMRRDERVFRLMLFVSPLVLITSWLHGVLLDASFRAYPTAYYVEHARELAAVAAPVIAIAAFLLYRGTRLYDHAWNRRTAAISFALQIAGWLLLRPLASTLMKVAEALRGRTLGAALASEAPALMIWLCAALPVLAIAFMFARLSIEAAARRKPQPAHRPRAARVAAHPAPRRA